jgi:hypothetical protein
MRDNLVAFLEAISYSPFTSIRVRPIVTGAPFVNYGVVTQARIGNVVDTQRRRRRSLPETVVTGTPSY